MARVRVTIRKYNGDDQYSWAVYVDGMLVRNLTGLNRSQAVHYRNQIRKSRGIV